MKPDYSDCCAWKRGRNDALFDPVDKRDYCGTCWQHWIQSKVEKRSKKRPRVSIPISTEAPKAEAKGIADEGGEECDVKGEVDEEVEGVLEGIVHSDNNLYLLNRQRSLVYSTERTPAGALVRVGKFESGKVVLDKSRVDSIPFLGHDPADNCETPLQAYRDLAPVLRRLCSQLGKLTRDLLIYDPYYCDGAVKRHLGVLGFPNVHNEPEDFYSTVGTAREVAYDVVVTNPPYSGDHVERMFRYLVAHGKPFFCLIPNYVYTKPFYGDIMRNIAGYPFYLTPETPRKYVYETPANLRAVKAAKLKTAPFASFWYCWTCPTYRLDLYQWYATRDDALALTLACTEYHLPDAFKDSSDKTRRKARKKSKNKAPDAVAGLSVGAEIKKKKKRRRDSTK